MTPILKQVFKATAEQIDNLLSELAKQPGFVFLDSADNKSHSFCAWLPVTLISTIGQETKISRSNGTVETFQDDPFLLIQKELAAVWPEQLKNPSTASSPKLFCGGAIGYWGYELGGRVERLPSPKAHDIDLPDMYVGIYDCALKVDRTTSALELQGKPERFEKFVNSVNKILNTDSKCKAKPFSLESDWQGNMSKAEYSNKFNKVKEYLAAGDCYQVNLAQRFDAQYQGDEWQAYQALREANQAPYSAFIRTQTGAILSVSPERFLQVQDSTIETKPIKGTRPRNANPVKDKLVGEELRNAEKDRAENLMIVDLLRNDLSKVAVAGSVQVPSLFAIESYPAVHHLVSTVTATLREPFNSIDLLRGAFPGGSITGAPKIRAMEIIHELEPHPRSVYCGAIGYILPNGDMDTNITIRTLVCNKERIYCWAGGGLVADSDLNSEYQETLDKVNKILPVLTKLNE